MLITFGLVREIEKEYLEVLERSQHPAILLINLGKVRKNRFPYGQKRVILKTIPGRPLTTIIYGDSHTLVSETEYSINLERNCKNKSRGGKKFVLIVLD